MTNKEAMRIVGHLLEGRSTINCEARNTNGYPVNYLDKSACQFCLIGAIKLVAHKLATCDVSEFFNEAQYLLTGKSYPEFVKLADIWDNAGFVGHGKIIEKLKSA